MEKRLPKITRFLTFSLYLFASCFAFKVEAQAPVQSEQLRIQIWADLDPYPGHFEDDGAELKENVTSDADVADDEFHKVFGHAIKRAGKIAPFLMEGMIYGWNFEYTPYDKTRRVDEYWSFQEVQPFNNTVNKLSFHFPEVKEDRLVCWVYCDRTKAQQLEYKRWTSIVHPHVKGIGSAGVENEFDGIRDAVSNAAKDAVREYWRTLVKNKPKEISGSLLLVRDPRIYVRNGKYVVDLDFLLETVKIVPYTYY